MASFVVLEPEGLNEKDKAADTVFVRDGIALIALIFPFFWLLFKRLWLEAFVVLAATIAIGTAANTSQFASAVPFLIFLISVLVALEGNNWRIAKLRRRGFIEKAVIDANDLDEAEIRYFAGHVQFAQQPKNPSPVMEKNGLHQPVKPSPSFQPIGSQIGLVSHRGDNS